MTFTNLSPSELIEKSISLHEGKLTDTGALLIETGKRTGRSPNDRFIVKELFNNKTIIWTSASSFACFNK